MSSFSYPKVLSIAGSDSGGGAGIQADLKAISANQGYGMTAITALTAQNTVGVRSIHPVPIQMLQEQIAAVAEDIGADAVKIGMLHASEVIEAVAASLQRYSLGPVILDPVMVATSGDPLLEPSAIHSLKEILIPIAELITPNLPEAALLLGRQAIEKSELLPAAKQLHEQFGVSVLLKGGHLSGEELIDVWVSSDGTQVLSFPSSRIDTPNTHGTGCTLSSAIATFRARGFDLPMAVEKGLAYVHQAIVAGKDRPLGQGHGPVHHFHPFW
ncbi:MAG: bifunctional hydroxymethylpyrimidine kinase/phosphomethylpyrimidine kinase [Bacteroidota bacterium]